ncbi:Protein of unknown function DUF3411 [Klebsormidium nitens]|uniref:Uncharacterized protein n=1 Tax=Klebsormidium nitens TaxID=105231 RepID=A0A1Y1IGG5_KLENI|nr:Protein of unknown function DUF3411 [Klebsormidium nitens]|eukprot:GAQ87807.1 Protein of unknown function DUF3411 [Klebsormidium nitens]
MHKKLVRGLMASNFGDAQTSIDENVLVTAGGGGGVDGTGIGGGGGGGDNSYGGEGDGKSKKNVEEALAVLKEASRSLESLPSDLAQAIERGAIPGFLVEKFLDLEGTPVIGLFTRFSGFRERLLADDLFLTKVLIECGVGMFTKTAAEYERRRENFYKELDFVIADVVMALVADFMLVWLPAPTVALRPAPGLGSNAIMRFFFKCPDNAFQKALPGQDFSLLLRAGSILRNGAKLFGVGTGASLIGTLATNSLSKIRVALNPDYVAENEDLPVISTSVAYGAYMAISSNIRYQLLAGVVEQRVLEPFLHKHKLALGVSSFVVRTGNTFLGSLLWVDYARWVGVQGSKE